MGFTLSYMYLRTKLNSSTSTPKRVALSTPGVLNVHAVTFGLTLKESADLEKPQEGSHISLILSVHTDNSNGVSAKTNATDINNAWTKLFQIKSTLGITYFTGAVAKGSEATL